MSQEDQAEQQRESTLYSLITFIGVGAFVAFIVMISKGALLYMMLGVLGVFGIGFLHYILWGASLDAEAAEEREALEYQEQFESEKK